MGSFVYSAISKKRSVFLRLSSARGVKLDSAPAHAHTQVTVHSTCPSRTTSPVAEAETEERRGERSSSRSCVTWGCLGGALILNPAGEFQWSFTLFRQARSRCFREKVECWGEERRWDVKYLCEVWPFTEKREGCVCIVCVCVCLHQMPGKARQVSC